MRIKSAFAAVALGVSALGLGGCATGLDTKVTRYQPHSIPAGASFYVVPRDGAPSPQFYRYASMLSQQLQSYGYQPAGAPQAADMLVRVDYGVGDPETVVRSDPFYGPGYGGYGMGWRDPFFNPYWGSWGRPYYSRWGNYPYYYGWNDPWMFGAGGYRGIDAYTVYKSHFDMDIVQRATNAPLFEGHAQARSRNDELDRLMPSLIQAMFAGFPGRNGETVRITIPDQPR
jgi:hypothetical protein